MTVARLDAAERLLAKPDQVGLLLNNSHSTASYSVVTVGIVTSHKKVAECNMIHVVDELKSQEAQL